MQFVLSAEGQKIMRDNGFVVLPKPLADGFDKLPPELKRMSQPWTK